MPRPARLIEPVDLHLPRLPPALLGLRILHLTDPHIRAFGSRQRRMIREVAEVPCDLVCFTGDAMDRKGDESVALEVLGRLCEAARPTHGVFGTFGNHDTPEFITRSRHLPMRWLANEAVCIPGLPLQLLGLPHATPHQADAALLALRAAEQRRASRAALPGIAPHAVFTLLLTHDPGAVCIAADLRINLMLAGHTHGGQVRLPTRKPLVNASSIPLTHSSGVLRQGATTAVVSRGLGETKLNLRFFCAPHAPLITLRYDGDATPPTSSRLQVLRRW